tara:strand:- start:5 stop:553 length:549 start_codon:yes stop_codon:yes gene_type:complete
MALSQTSPVNPESIGYIRKIPKTIEEQRQDILREVINPYARESGLVTTNKEARDDWISDDFILYVGRGFPPIDPRTQQPLFFEKHFVKIGQSNRSFKIRTGNLGYSFEQLFQFNFPAGTIRREVSDAEDEALYAIRKKFDNYITILNTMGACREVFPLESLDTVLDVCHSLQLDEVFPPTVD